jgi:aerotaxis receptor
MLELIQAEYESLFQAEKTGEVSPEQSAAMFEKRINELGYADYHAFESDCLMQELAARDLNMGNPVRSDILIFGKMMETATKLKAETKALSDGFEAISTVPTNMRIIAARLEPSGGAVSSLSQNYWSMSEEMSDWFNLNVNNADSEFAAIHSTLNSCRFMFGTARVLTVLSNEFNQEQRALGDCYVENEKLNIEKLTNEYISKATSGLQQVARVAKQIVTSVEIMRRYTLGLSSTRVMCSIESARLPNGGGSLVDVITQLGRFQNEVEKQLDSIEDLSLQIQDHAKSLTANRGGLDNRLCA